MSDLFRKLLSSKLHTLFHQCGLRLVQHAHYIQILHLAFTCRIMPQACNIWTAGLRLHYSMCAYLITLIFQHIYHNSHPLTTANVISYREVIYAVFGYNN